MSGIRDRLRGVRDDEGSTLPLILGYAVLVIALVSVCVCATDLHIAQKRLDALADAASLAGADGFTLVVTADGVRAELSDAGVSEQARAMLDAVGADAVIVAAHAPDGVSAEVTLRLAWHPPLFSPFVPEGVLLESTSRSRTAFR